MALAPARLSHVTPAPSLAPTATEIPPTTLRILPTAPILPAPAVAPVDLDAAIRGRVIRPGHEEFETARRTHQLAVDARPALIVRVADAHDVAVTVGYARARGLELAVRAGGHSMAAHSTGEGVVVIDLSTMKDLHVETDSGLVWAEAGLTAGEVTKALAEHGLAIPFGDSASVGIAGLTLGGGIGYLARKHGLAIDHLVGAELVTADGRVLNVSATQSPDLFWAIRGGGGNFGIVTRFVYEAVKVGMVYGGALGLPATPEVLAGIAAAADVAPDELTLITHVIPAPPMPFLPESAVGKLLAFVSGVYDGDPEAGAAAFAPFRALAEPLFDLVKPMPYPAIYKFTEAGETPSAHVVRTAFLDSFDAAAAHVTLTALEAAPSPRRMFEIRALRGAVANVPADATAFAHRDARFMATIVTSFEGDETPHRAWADELLRMFRPMVTGAYVNFVGDEGEARVREAYPSETYARLAEIKAAYDPENVFRRNQNVRPAS